MKSCYMYLRVSSLSQTKGDGIPRQRHSIQSFCEVNNLKIKGFYIDEGVSGTIADRETIAEMFNDMHKNKVNIILVESLQRLAREILIQEKIIHEIQQKGFNLISVQEGSELESNDPTRVLVRQVIGAINSYDRSIVVNKLRVARERIRKQKGKCEGRKGYKDTREAQDIIREIKRLRRKRKGRGRRTYCQISYTMNANGYRTISGLKFTAQNICNICNRY